jgi:hypothetical protein
MLFRKPKKIYAFLYLFLLKKFKKINITREPNVNNLHMSVIICSGFVQDHVNLYKIT